MMNQYLEMTQGPIQFDSTMTVAPPLISAPNAIITQETVTSDTTWSPGTPLSQPLPAPESRRWKIGEYVIKI